MIITTATGKQYKVRWCAVSTFDGVLRFSVIGGTMRELIDVFMDSDETCKLSYKFDITVTEYEGYTIFKGIELQANGDINVYLMK